MGGPGPLPPPGADAVPRREIAAIVLLTLLGIALRLAWIGAEGLWQDEAVTFLLADVPLRGVLETFRAGNQTPAYPFLLRAWKAVFGDSEGALRSLSALGGILGIPLIWWVGRRLHSPRAGLWGAGLLAFSPLAIHYSQELRPYSFMMLASAAAIPLALRVRSRGGVGPVLLLAADWSFLALLHHVGAGLVAAMTFAALVPLPSARAVVRIGVAAAISAAAWSCWTFSAPQPVELGSVRMRNTADEGPLIPRALRSLSSHTPGTQLPVRNRVRRVPPRAWLSLALACPLAVIGFLRWPRGSPAGSRSLVYGSLLIYLALLPLPELIGVRVWIVGRTDSPALPFSLLAVGAGLASIPLRPSLLLGLPLAALCVFPLRDHYLLDHRSQERILARRILSVTDGDDLVVVTGVWYPGLRYYAERSEHPPEIRTFPPGYENRSLEWGWERTLGGLTVAQASDRFVSALSAEGRRRLWLVLDDDPKYRPLARDLERRFAPVRTIEVPRPLGLRVVELEVRPASAGPSSPAGGR